MPAPPGRRQQQPPTEADDAWGNARVAMALAVYDSQYPRCSELWDVFELRGEPWLRLEVCKGSVSGLLGYPRSLARPAPESLRPADGVSWCDVFCSFITPPPKQPEPSCCGAGSVQPVAAPADGPNCFLNDKWWLRNYCGRCDVVHTAFCSSKKCRTALCVKCEAAMHPLHNLRPNRPICGQVTLDPDHPDRYTITPRQLYRCSSCWKLTCEGCFERYTQLAILENVPTYWRDGQLVRALEEAIGSQIVGFERRVREQHCYIQFADQVMALGTQCIKLQCAAEGIAIQLKPPHAGRRLQRRPGYPCVEVSVPLLVSDVLQLETVLALLLLSTSLKTGDVRFAEQMPTHMFACRVQLANESAKCEFLESSGVVCVMGNQCCVRELALPHPLSGSTPGGVLAAIGREIRFRDELRYMCEYFKSHGHPTRE